MRNRFANEASAQPESRWPCAQSTASDSFAPRAFPPWGFRNARSPASIPLPSGSSGRCADCFQNGFRLRLRLGERISSVRPGTESRKAAKVVRVLPHVGESARRGVRIGESGNARAFKSSTPSATDFPPIQLASSGLPGTLRVRLHAFGDRAGSVIPCGARITSKPSLFGSSTAISSALA